MLQNELMNIFGSNAQFREGQSEAIEKVLQKKRLLVVQRTGWGKSLVYFLSTKIMRQRGEGVTLIVSPLLALTRNQIESATQYDLTAECINSQDNKTLKDKRALLSRCNSGDCDILFVTPEQLENDDFITMLSELRVGMFVVDEAHCISSWGHDFRPDYRRIHQLLQLLPNNIAVLATTATATERVVQDIRQQLRDCEVIRGPLTRHSLALHKIHMPNNESKYAWLLKNIPILEGSGIIYATTIKECESIAKWLTINGIQAFAYHGRLTNQEKLLLEDHLIHNQVKVLISTVALGMGYDKDDISFVIHYYTPQSVVEYYQQIGRAGRSIPQAICILLYGDPAEQRINQYFINSSFPKQEHINTVLHCIESYNDVNLTVLLGEVNLQRDTIEKILKLLTLEGFISKDQKKRYFRTVKPYISQKSYYEAVITQKKHDYQQLIDYQQTTECLMKFLTKALDDPYSHRCGKCSNCLKQQWNYTIDRLTDQDIQTVRAYSAETFNKLKVNKRSSITNRNLQYLCSEGFALSYYHDIIGQEVRKGKYQDGMFSDYLVSESVKKIISYLQKNNISPTELVVVPIPSNRRPTLVPTFAEKVAKGIGTGYANILAKKADEPEQKTLMNSRLQEQNVRDYLYIKPNSLAELSIYHILLIDDFVDSGWTFAVAADILGSYYQCPSITPFALSITGNGAR